MHPCRRSPLNGLWPVIQIPASAEEAISLATDYFSNKGWKTTVQDSETAQILRAQRRCKQLISPAPQRATWTIKQEKQGTTITIRQHLSYASIISTQLAFGLSLISVIIGFAIRHDPDPGRRLAITIATAIGTINTAGVLIAWFADRKNPRFIVAFRDYVFNQTGHCVTILDPGGVMAPSAPILGIDIMIMFAFGTGMIIKQAAIDLVGPRVIALLALLVVLALAMMASNVGRRLRNSGCYVMAAIIISIYAAYPLLDANSGNTTSTARILMLLIIDAGLFLLLWILARVTRYTSDNIVFAESNESQFAHQVQRGAIISLWAFTAYAQLQAITWAVSRIITKGPHDTLPELLWLLPLIVAHALIIAKAKSRQKSQDINTAPPQLQQLVSTLARKLDTTTPFGARQKVPPSAFLK